MNKREILEKALDVCRQLETKWPNLGNWYPFVRDTGAVMFTAQNIAVLCPEFHISDERVSTMNLSIIVPASRLDDATASYIAMAVERRSAWFC